MLLQLLMLAQAPPPPPLVPERKRFHRMEVPAGPPPERGPWWRQLNLTSEQMNRINDILVKHRQEATVLRGKRSQLKAELEAELLKDSPSMSRIRSLLKEISDVEYRLRLSSIERVLEIEGVLTPQQREQLSQMFPGRGWRTRLKIRR